MAIARSNGIGLSEIFERCPVNKILTLILNVLLAAV